MIKKQHGPAFGRCLIPLTECPSCHGAGLVRGVFHQLECFGCHSSGFVHAETLEPLPLEELVIQLGIMFRRSRLLLSNASAVACDARQYQQPNRRGPGGSSYKGD